MDTRVEKTLQALKRNGFEAYYAEDESAAVELVQTLIPKACSIGIGDSATVRELGILDALEKEGRTIVNPVSELIVEELNAGRCDMQQHLKLQKLSLMCDYFLTGTNALTEDGVLMNTDAAGNRVAGMFFGPENVVLVIGTNKIVPDIEAGMERLRNNCGPQHTKTKHRKTPCAVTGHCVNCNSPERLCRVTSFIEKKPLKTNIKIVLVDGDYGLGWDASWEKGRIEDIYDRYAEVTHTRRPEWLK